MQTLHRQVLVLTLVILCGVNYIQSVSVTNAVWDAYVMDFNKNYATATDLANARYYFAYNSQLIANHNAYAARGRYAYTLEANQFTDMRLVTFNALFPVTTRPTINNASPLPSITHTAPPTYDSRFNNGITITVQDQGVRCSSGWAYATAAATALLDAQRIGTTNPEPLSGQQLIDCAGLGRGCTGQVPEAAFDYLTLYELDLKLQRLYPINIESSTPLACRATSAMTGINLYKYSAGIADANESQLRYYVSAGYPVVTEFNPTSFEFMHYKSGVFTQPATSTGSHYMVVIGYDANNWILQNSFGTTWGENGFMTLKRNDVNANLPKSATLPTE